MTESVIAKRLREARVALDISQRELGIRAGIDEFVASARINQYERAKHEPDFATAERLADVLGVPTPYLYARDDDMAALLLRLAKVSPEVIRELISSL